MNSDKAYLQNPNSPDVWLQSGQIPLLDGFRALAVISVLLAHACQTHGFPELAGLAPLLKHGELGVDLFFVISGFLITTLLIRERNRNGHVSLRNFYIRRSLRIFPVYYCSLLVVFLLQSLGVFHLKVSDWIGALTYTTNFLWTPSWELGHVWSLSIEEHFYLIWPFCFVVLGVSGCIRAAICCVIFGLAGRIALLVWFPHDAWMAGRFTFTRADAIVMGCLLAIAVQTPGWRRHLDRISGLPGMPLAAVVGLVLSTSLGEFSYRYKVAVGYPATGCLLTLLLWSVLIRCEHRSARWLQSSALREIGIRSYSLYLWQQIFLNPNYAGILTWFPFNIAAAFATAWISYRYLETPFQTLRHRFAAPQAVPAASTDSALPDSRDGGQPQPAGLVGAGAS